MQADGPTSVVVLLPALRLMSQAILVVTSLLLAQEAAPAAPAPALSAEAKVPIAPNYDVTVRVPAPVPSRSASSTTRDRAALATAPHLSTDHLLSLVPGLFITQHGGEGKAFQIFYRGFDAVHGQDLEIWAGGVPVNDVSNIHGQGYADLHFLPVEVVEELRALPGSFDPRQGDFAIAGSVHLRLGYDRPGTTVKGGFGSFGMRRLFSAYRPPHAGSETFAALELYETEGFGVSRAASRASAVGQKVWRLDADWKVRALGILHAGRFDAAGVLRLADLESGRVDRFDTYDPRQGGASSRGQALLEAVHGGIEERITLSLYGVLRGLRLQHNFTGFLTSPAGDGQRQRHEAGTIGAHGSYRRRVGWLAPGDKLEVGFFARMDRIAQSQSQVAFVDDSITGRNVDADVTARQLAGFVDLELHPWRRLTLRGGGRIDALTFGVRDRIEALGTDREANGLVVNPRATADVWLCNGVHGVASYGGGFRSPQARSLVDGQRAPFARSRAMEVGLSASFETLTASFAVFRTSVSEDLVFDHVTTRNEAVPGTTRLGTTADVSAAPLTWLLLNAGLTYTEARFDGSDTRHRSGELLPYVPQLVGRLDLRLKGTIGRWGSHAVQAELGSGWSLLARRPLPYGEFGDDVFLLDAAARLQVGSVAISAESMNLTDAHWYDGQFVYPGRFDRSSAPSLIPERCVTVGAPRLFMLSVSLFL